MLRAGAMLAALGGLLGGCASNEPVYQSSGGVHGSRLVGEHSWGVVGPTEEITAYEASPWGTYPEERPEYVRRDEHLAVRAPGPILATSEWPQPAPPRERRFRFQYWRSD